MEKEILRKELWGLLGDLPERGKVSSRLIKTEENERFVTERLMLELNGIESVPAIFVKPHGDGKFPVVLFFHAHGGAYSVGKSELLRRADWNENEPYGEFLTKMGYAALCIDMWGFGERRGLSEKEIYKQMAFRGQVMWGMMCFDAVRAIDYLEMRGDVCLDNLTTIGSSMGGFMSQWAAALDERIKRCVCIAALADFDELIAKNQIGRHGIYLTIPSFLKNFSTPKMLSLIAPRKLLLLTGKYDTLSPVSAFERVRREVEAEYLRCGAPENFELKVFGSGHYESAQMRSEVKKLLEEDVI